MKKKIFYNSEHNNVGQSKPFTGKEYECIDYGRHSASACVTSLKAVLGDILLNFVIL